MKLTTTAASSGSRMGFLFVFFPEENQNQQEIARKPNNFNLFPFSSSINRTSIFNLVYRAQPTISICLLLLFTTLLLFTLSTLPPAATTGSHSSAASSTSNLSRALQGMGALYGRGTMAMNDVVVAHALESLSLDELGLFLRLFFRSGLAAKSDLVLVFPTRTVQLDELVIRERDSFVELLTRYKSADNFTISASGFDPSHYKRAGKEVRESGEPIWGRKNRVNQSEDREAESTRPSYGSVVGFDVNELDPENSQSGFLEHVPMSLRRWACYPMLLGRVRRKFKHVMLVDIKNILVLSDPLGRVRNHSPESVFLNGVAQSSSGRHGKKKNSENTESARPNSVDTGVIIGGLRGVRRLSSAMLTDIVRFSIHHKKKNKNSVTESVILNQLVRNEYMPKGVNLIMSAEPLTELSSLTESGFKPSSHLFLKNYGVIKSGNRNLDDIKSMVMDHICSFPIDSTVYSDCQ